MNIIFGKIFEIFAAVDNGCKESFFGLPHWYKYLDVQKMYEYKDEDGATQNINIHCVPQVHGLGDFWLIGLAVLEVLIRVALYVGIAFVIYAGIKYSESRGNVDKAEKAKFTLIDAITGVVIAMIAVALINFIAGRFGQSG